MNGLELCRTAAATAGIYLHIPFCQRRCIYCDFFSSTDSGKKAAYVEALCQELVMRKEYLDGRAIATVYFGGGTPSQLAATDFQRIFDTIFTHYEVCPSAEITLEANPDDLTEAYLESLSALPFNRLSMGIQTFHEETLRLLRRRHTATQAIAAFHRCRQAGFGNLSIDLMYGLPGETQERWEDDLQQALLRKKEVDKPVQPHAANKPQGAKQGVVEIDLHIGELLDDTRGMSSGEILRYQLDKFHEVMEQYKNKREQRIVFIHGKGDGVLRKALLQELKRKYPNCRHQDASFQEYGFGATMVTIK